jgi:thiamine-phosphate pyrophosphorylase
MHALPRLYTIIDTSRDELPNEELYERVGRIAAAGGRMFQLREKHKCAHDRLEFGRRIASLLVGYRAHFFVNDRADICLLLDADGVHLPRGGLPIQSILELSPSARVGVSCHDIDALVAAQRAGASFATLSPIFSPKTPQSGPALGVEGLSKAAENTEIPIYALGGVTPSQCQPCLAAGAYGVAAVGSLMRADDPYQTTRDFLEALGEI